MTWFSSTPVSFSGGPEFFCRDSGLICKGLQSVGIDCKSVMPLPTHPGDVSDDLIRTNAINLVRPEWWGGIGATKVVLYSWGDPKFRQVAEAVRRSGAKVFINLDSSGIVTPKVTPRLYYQSIIGKHIRLHGRLVGIMSGALNYMMHSIGHRFYVPFAKEPHRIAHLRTATAIGCISPGALTLWRLWARNYAPELVQRMHLVPHPVVNHLKYNPDLSKQDIVVAVGRWDDEEPKRPALLCATIAETAKQRSRTEFHIYGNPGRLLPEWYSGLSDAIKRRVYLHGCVPHSQIADALARSRIALCSSSHEGSHIASEEALCCGASVVAPFRYELNVMSWYVSHDSGALSIEDSEKGLAETLLLELDAWDHGKRDPVSISSYWHSLLSTSAVVSKIMELLD